MKPDAEPIATDYRIDTLLLDQWQADPRHPALIVGGSVVTAGELRDRVLGLAGVLQARGLRPGDRVAVYLERSADFIVAVLGAVVAGACHAAFDVGDPPRRTGEMIEDCAPRLVVTRTELAARLPEGTPICLVDERDPNGADQWRPVAADPERPAVIIYTSGSTGRPKASLISHRALVTRLNALQKSHRMDASDRIVHHTACNFDMFLIEVYWPLLAGATVVIAEAGRQRDPDYLAGLIRDAGITTFYCVVSLLDLFLASRDPAERYDGLRQVLTGGEPLSPELVKHFYRRSSATLTNLYGPSECTIYCTAWACPRDPDLQTVLIGTAIDDTSLWIVGPDGRPVAPGETGELYVGGAGLALGYLNREELTAQRFVPDRLGASGGRLYRSGDLVSLHPNGALEFHGRVDQQVKVRGYRIELGEIEDTALRCPGVRQAAVVAHGEGREKSLAAFLVACPGTDGDELTAVVRAALRDRLPGYMVPALLNLVDELPLTPGGKLDRGRLAGLAAADPGRGQDPEPPPVHPDDPTADLATAVWHQVLGTGDIGPQDDFFDIGGDSFMAMRVVQRLAGLLGIDIPVRTLLYEPTLAGFTAELEQLTNQETQR
ncbi:non-ribosomal peptide synthetase [Streptomyces canus]|uniref:non-ribosomal peptide synthetase n=1 Tax=Streptomyces canus TaxID=58343 RepID=UPI0036CBB38B